jgi:ribosomal protein S18 acetylase RimI-like enzyme
MIVHDCIQGSAIWLQLRSGIPTASCFDQILTPTGKRSTSAKSYMHKLIAERIMGHPCVEAVSTWMQRGNDLEAEAVSFYEFQRDLDTVTVGFITNGAGTIGASPDRLVGTDGLLEIKVPKEHTHVGYLLGAGVDQAYRPQVQGQLWIAEKLWSDTLSFHPEMPPALNRAERDEEFIVILAEAVEEFAAKLEMEWARILEQGIAKAPQVPIVSAPDGPGAFGITDEDIAALTADRFPQHA